MNELTLNVRFEFAASHFLTKYHGKCENLHGHNYKLIVTIKGPLQDDGMVLDFKIIKKIVESEIIDKLDHHHLNDIIENPSAEHLSIWIWEKLEGKIPLKKITVYETDNYYCEYEGE